MKKKYIYLTMTFVFACILGLKASPTYLRGQAKQAWNYDFETAKADNRMACLSVPGHLNPPKQTNGHGQTAKRKNSTRTLQTAPLGKRPSENTTTIAFSDGLSAASAGHQIRFAKFSALPTYDAGVKSSNCCFAPSGISKSRINDASTSGVMPPLPRVKSFSFS